METLTKYFIKAGHGIGLRPGVTINVFKALPLNVRLAEFRRATKKLSERNIHGNNR